MGACAESCIFEFGLFTLGRSTLIWWQLSPGLDGSMAGSMAGLMTGSMTGSMAPRWLDACSMPKVCDHTFRRHQASMARWLDGDLDGSMATSMAR